MAAVKTEVDLEEGTQNEVLNGEEAVEDTPAQPGSAKKKKKKKKKKKSGMHFHKWMQQCRCHAHLLARTRSRQSDSGLTHVLAVAVGK